MAGTFCSLFCNGLIAAPGPLLLNAKAPSKEEKAELLSGLLSTFHVSIHPLALGSFPIWISFC